ncbi:MAG TPA: HlyD family secretion protein, partial [Hyphomicrobiaceae bacterium]
PKLMVSSDVSGLVSEVLVHEGQAVRKGDVLFRIDPRQFQIALDNAKAQLAQTALNLQAMKEDYRRMLSDAASQAAQVELAQKNYDRAVDLSKKGIASVQSFDQARSALDAALKQQQSLCEQAKVQLAKMGGKADFAVTEHPAYLQAKAQLDEAQRQLDHSVVRAPLNGIVTQVDQLQPGVYLVSATAALTNNGAVALVSTDDVWIDANFKETDLTWVKPGDIVEISVDTYPGRTWKGRVKSIAPASGAEFSILPAQNASGNWVKVVQRIPVRIAVERRDGDPPLRAGMSAYVTIDTGHQRSLSELW